MAYDERTAERVRRLLSTRPDVVERPMIGGGLGFMVDGKLCCGVSSSGLTVRVGEEAKAEVLDLNHVRPHLVGERETAAFVVIQPGGYDTTASLRKWIERGLTFVASLSD